MVNHFDKRNRLHTLQIEMWKQKSNQNKNVQQLIVITEIVLTVVYHNQFAVIYSWLLVFPYHQSSHVPLRHMEFYFYWKPFDVRFMFLQR